MSETYQELKDRRAAIRQQVFKRDNYKCCKCGTKHKLTLDHIVPKSAGGLFEFLNLQTLCKKCNFEKKDYKINYCKYFVPKVICKVEIQVFKPTSKTERDLIDYLGFFLYSKKDEIYNLYKSGKGKMKLLNTYKGLNKLKLKEIMKHFELYE